MSLKSIFRNSVLFLISIQITFLILAFSLSAQDAFDEHSQYQINVIYPKAGQVITAKDSTFILGNIKGVEREEAFNLWVNYTLVRVPANGTFLAFVPIQPDSFVFDLRLNIFRKNYSKKIDGRIVKFTGVSDIPFKTISHQIKVYIPPPLKPIPIDTMLIVKEFKPPSGDLVLTAGDELRVSFHGTPEHRAWFSIPGIVDSVPMSETKPQYQTYWGEAVFGAGAVPDSLLVRGIYTGSWTIPSGAQIDTTRIIYHLAPPHPVAILQRLYRSTYDPIASRLARYLKMKKIPTVDTVSAYRITLNSPDYPFTVRFTDSVQTVRYGPVKGYQSIFQPKNIEALAVGAEGDWYKIKLSQTQFGWVNKNSVEKLDKGIRPPNSFLKNIRVKSNGRKITVEFPLAGKHPFKITESNRKTLVVQLFGVTTDTDWIRYDESDSLIDLITWSQPQPGLYEARIELNNPLWGFDSYYNGNTFTLDLIKPPDKIHSIKNKIIVVDPGHSADPGSIGPSGYTEAEANLAIALELKNKLESRGAKVIMTRMDGANVPLYDRPTIAKLNNADMFVSVHNNALPDGVNPYTNNGTSTYYYHPHSIDLGRAIHKQMLKATELPDHGFYHGNLAVNRPTQYPAVLVECAFMIIPEQEEMLKTDRFRKRVAAAITTGIEKFLKDFDRD